MGVTIEALPALSGVDVTDDDIIPIWDESAPSANTKGITRGDFLVDVVREEGNHTLGTIDADEVNAPLGAIDALTVATSLTLGAAITKILKGVITVTATTLAADATEDHAKTLTGAVSGDVVLFSVDAPAAGLDFRAWVSGADTLTVRVTNNSGGSIAGATYTLRVIAIRAT